MLLAPQDFWDPASLNFIPTKTSSLHPHTVSWISPTSTKSKSFSLKPNLTFWLISSPTPMSLKVKINAGTRRASPGISTSMEFPTFSRLSTQKIPSSFKSQPTMSFLDSPRTLVPTPKTTNQKLTAPNSLGMDLQKLKLKGLFFKKAPKTPPS